MFDANCISTVSNVTSEELTFAVNKLKKNNKLSILTRYFIDAEKQYDINAVILLAIACLESDYGLSKLAIERNNLFGLDARDSLKGTSNYGKIFKTKEECILHAGHRLGQQYLKEDKNASWRYCKGKKDIWTIGEKWCSKKDWGDKIVNIATRLEDAIKEYNDRMNNEKDYKKMYLDLRKKVDNFIKELEKENKRND